MYLLQKGKKGINLLFFIFTRCWKTATCIL